MILKDLNLDLDRENGNHSVYSFWLPSSMNGESFNQISQIIEEAYFKNSKFHKTVSKTELTYVPKSWFYFLGKASGDVQIDCLLRKNGVGNFLDVQAYDNNEDASLMLFERVLRSQNKNNLGKNISEVIKDADYSLQLGLGTKKYEAFKQESLYKIGWVKDILAFNE